MSLKLNDEDVVLARGFVLAVSVVSFIGKVKDSSDVTKRADKFLAWLIDDE